MIVSSGDCRGKEAPLAKITAVTTGKIVDMDFHDSMNMGAAMAPAACDTILTHLKDTGREPDYYDLIVTGDLGALGSRIVKDLTLSLIHI